MRLGAVAATAFRLRPAWTVVAAAFVASRLALVLVVAIATSIFPDAGHHVAVASRYPFLEPLARWDANRYIAIATHGYRAEDVAFFPLFPVALRIVGVVAGDRLLAALVCSNAALLVAMLALYELVGTMFDERVAERAVWFLAFFPTTIFLSSAYSESLFLALVLATFLAMRREQWLTAGFFGGLAALTRVEGILLSICFAIEVCRSTETVAALKASRAVRGQVAVGFGMIVVGLATFMVVLVLLGRSPIAFEQVQANWHRHVAAPWEPFVTSARTLGRHASAATRFVQSTEWAATVLLIVTTAWSAVRLKVSYTVYAGLSLLVPLLSGTLMSMPRFALTIFPTYVMLAVLSRSMRVGGAFLAVSAATMAMLSAVFVTWRWIA